MALSYTKTVYANGVAPALSATNLNKNETALQAVSDWADGLLASTGVPNSAKAVKALGADLAALLTAAGFSLAPATGTDNLDNIADGTTYKKVLAAIATALNASTIVAGTQWGSGNDGNAGQPPAPKPTTGTPAGGANGVGQVLKGTVTAGNTLYHSGGTDLTGTWDCRYIAEDDATGFFNYYTRFIGAGGIGAAGAGVTLWFETTRVA